MSDLIPIIKGNMPVVIPDVLSERMIAALACSKMQDLTINNLFPVVNRHWCEGCAYHLGAACNALQNKELRSQEMNCPDRCDRGLSNGS